MQEATLDQILRSMGYSAAEIPRFRELLNSRGPPPRALGEAHHERSGGGAEYAELVHECGIDRVYGGMRKAWTHIKYLPCAAEVREYLPGCRMLPKRRPPTTRIAPTVAARAGSQSWSTPNSYSVTKGV